MFNKVILIGRIGQNAEAKTAQNNREYVTLNASATPCWSQTITGMAYWLDNSDRPTVASGNSLKVQANASVGHHNLHVAELTRFGTCSTASVGLFVAPSPLSSVPSNAITVSAIQAMPGWFAADETSSSSGTATGTTQLVSSPSLSGNARSFVTSYSNAAGERCSVVFDSDPSAAHFLYDTWIWLADPSSDIANLEFDVDQVLSNGETVSFGVQCDGYSNTWHYTANLGTPQNFNDQWQHSSSHCDPHAWSTNTWHHLQLTYTRDSQGNVTYKAIYGVQQDINATVNSEVSPKSAPNVKYS